MKLKFKHILLLFTFAIPAAIALASMMGEHPQKIEMKVKADGPYIIYKGNSATIITANNNGKVSSKQYNIKSLPDSIEVISENGNHRFTTPLHKITTPPDTYDQPQQIYVISDPHGNMDAFVSILKAGKVINDKYEWIYGKNHLFIIGDIFDRGSDVLPILWLCYKLDYEAAKAGGTLHFTNGNHEDMVLSGNYKYTIQKYRDIAKELKMEYKQLFSNDTELGRWIRSKNIIEKIGPYLFVHAGISTNLAKRNVSITDINDTMRMYFGVGKKNIKDTVSIAYSLFDRSGPIWYRGLVLNDEKYSPISQKDLDNILSLYEVDRIIVGHTIFDSIEKKHTGKVITVNVDNNENMEKQRPRALLIEGKKFTTITDEGIKRKLSD